MERYLTADVNLADYIVDLSNVLRNARLGGSAPVDVSRFAHACDTLVRANNDQHLRVYAVADATLLRSGPRGGSPSDRALLAGWRDRNLIEVVPYADPRILELSELTGIRILSGDRYRDERDTFPWLQDNSTRVVEIVSTSKGSAVRPVVLGHVSPTALSTYQERSEFNRLGLLTGDRRRPRLDVLDRFWGCPVADCHRHDGRGTTIRPPWVRDGVVTCEDHRRPLTDAGPRPGAVPVKIMVDGVRGRGFTVHEGVPVTMGRAPGSAGPDLTEWLGSEVVGRSLSRSHLELRLVAGRLLARDVSSFGTGLRRAGGDDEPILLEPGVDHRVQPGDTLVLTKRIAIVRSGRMFAEELTEDWPEPGRTSVDTATTGTAETH